MNDINEDFVSTEVDGRLAHSLVGTAETGASCFQTREHIRRVRGESTRPKARAMQMELLGETPAAEMGASMLVGLSDASLEMLSVTMPSLLCGEESAVIVFANLGLGLAGCTSAYEVVQTANAVMADISREECFHEYLLSHLVVALRADELSTAKEARRKARMFYMRLQSKGIETHLARISALDSFVARTLSACQSRTSELRHQSALMRVFEKIRFDEGGHVRATRSLLLRAGVSPSVIASEREYVAAAYRRYLHHMLPCMDRIGVDPDKLINSIK